MKPPSAYTNRRSLAVMPTVLAFGLTLWAACGAHTSESLMTSTTTPSASTREGAEPQPPLAKRLMHVHRMHGEEREDPYFWMRDDDREDPEILAHLRAENDYAEAVMEPLDGFRDRLYEEIISRIPQDDSSVPYRRDGWWYYRRVEEGKEYPILCRREGSLDAPESVYFDANVQAEGQAYYGLGGASVSVDGHTLAYAEDLVSRRIYTLRFRNLVTGEEYPEVIEGTTGGAVWAMDNATVFYVKRDPETLRAYQVWRHRLGQAASEDVLVFEEQDTEFYVRIARSRSREKILIGSYQTLSHEYRAIDAHQPESDPVLCSPAKRITNTTSTTPMDVIISAQTGRRPTFA